MKYIFMGSGHIAKKCLEQCLSDANGSNLPVAIIADKNCLSIFDWPPSIIRIEISVLDKKEDVIRSVLEDIKPDFLISVQYPWILSQSILESVGRVAFNIHNARLPDYRGHNALSYEILNGDKTHISTLHLMDTVVDRGFYVKCAEIEIIENDTAFSLWERSVESCVSLFSWLVIYENFKDYNKLKTPIVGEGRYYGKRDIQTAKIVPNDANPSVLLRYARAFHFPPHEPAYLLVGNTKIHLCLNRFESYNQVK